MARITANPIEMATLVPRFWTLISFSTTMNQDSLKKELLSVRGRSTR